MQKCPLFDSKGEFIESDRKKSQCLHPSSIMRKKKRKGSFRAKGPSIEQKPKVATNHAQSHPITKGFEMLLGRSGTSKQFSDH